MKSDQLKIFKGMYNKNGRFKKFLNMPAFALSLLMPSVLKFKSASNVDYLHFLPKNWIFAFLEVYWRVSIKMAFWTEDTSIGIV